MNLVSFKAGSVLVLHCPLCQFLTRQLTTFMSHCHQSHTECINVTLYECSHCQIKATHKDFLHEHIILDHKNLKDAMVVQLSQFTLNSISGHPALHYRCQLCPFQCAWPEAVSDHYATIHGVRSVSLVGQAEHVRTSTDSVPIQAKRQSMPATNGGLPNRYPQGSLRRPSNRMMGYPVDLDQETNSVDEYEVGGIKMEPHYPQSMTRRSAPVHHLNGINLVEEDDEEGLQVIENGLQIGDVFSCTTMKLAPENQPQAPRTPKVVPGAENTLQQSAPSSGVPFQCPKCSISRMQLSGLLAHCKSKHRMSFTHRNELRKRLTQDEPLDTSAATPAPALSTEVVFNYCPFCPSKNRRIHDMITHIRNKHKISEAEVMRIKQQLKDCPHPTEKRVEPVLSKPPTKAKSKAAKRLSALQVAQQGGDRPVYPCELCPGVMYLKKGSLRIHMQSVHEATMPDLVHKCPFCDKLFAHVSSMRRHATMYHDGTESPQGSKAGSSHLRTTIGKSQTRTSRFACTTCGKKMRDARQLRKHMSNHRGKVRASAPTGDIPVEREIATVQEEAHPAGAVDCPRCGMEMEGRAALLHHMVVDHSVPILRCALCSEECISRAELSAHQAEVHGMEGARDTSMEAESRQEVAPTVNNNQHQCPHCDNIYYSISGLHKHLKTKHLQQTAIQKQPPTAPMETNEVEESSSDAHMENGVQPSPAMPELMDEEQVEQPVMILADE